MYRMNLPYTYLHPCTRTNLRLMPEECMQSAMHIPYVCVCMHTYIDLIEMHTVHGYK
jgi:hypothetical protein